MSPVRRQSRRPFGWCSADVMEVRIPKLGVSMSEGTLVEWLGSDGETVAAGAPIYLLETDKVESEIESPMGGVVRLLVPHGETYAVGTLIAELT